MPQSSVPVSYTHLDVYKRQVCDRGYEAYNNIAHLQQAGWKYVMRIKEQEAFGIADGLQLPCYDEFDQYMELSLTRKNSLETVSYTHLDVYKRQV